MIIKGLLNSRNFDIISGSISKCAKDNGWKSQSIGSIDCDSKEYPIIKLSKTASTQTVVIACSIHGDEPSGTFAVEEMIKSFRPGWNGTIYPIINPHGFVNNTRGNYHDLDPNRNWFKNPCEEAKIIQNDLVNVFPTVCFSCHEGDVENAYAYVCGKKPTLSFLRKIFDKKESGTPQLHFIHDGIGDWVGDGSFEHWMSTKAECSICIEIPTNHKDKTRLLCQFICNTMKQFDDLSLLGRSNI